MFLYKCRTFVYVVSGQLAFICHHEYIINLLSLLYNNMCVHVVVEHIKDHGRPNDDGRSNGSGTGRGLYHSRVARLGVILRDVFHVCLQQREIVNM